MVGEKVLKSLVEVEPEGELRLVWIDPSSALDNPMNWRTHPEAQTEAVRHLIFEEGGVGWAGAGLINERKVEDGWSEEEAFPTLIDGHDRKEVAVEEGGAMPFLVGSWGPDKERVILATLDPVGAMATINYDAQLGLLELIVSDNDVVNTLIDRMRETAEIMAELGNETFSVNLPAGDGTKLEQKEYHFKVRVNDTDQFETVAEAVRQLILDEGFDATVTV